MAEAARPGSWTGSLLLARVLRFGAAGAAVALVFGVREVWLQGYASLGWSYSIAHGLREAVLTGAAIGAVGALALGAVRDNLVASLPRADGWLSVEGLRTPRKRRFLVGLGAALLVAGGLVLWRIQDEGGFPATSLPWALACGLMLATTLALAGGLPARRGSAGIWAALFLCGWMFLGSDPYGRAELAAGVWSGPGAALAAAALVFGCLAAAAPAERGLLRWLSVPGLPLLIGLGLVLIAPLLGPTLRAGNPRNLVLIAVDTLRMDRTSLAPGDERALTLTPSLSELGQQSAVFTEATAQAPWTLPSFASVLTGLYPAEHGATSIQGLLRRVELPLAEVLREAGYRTAGVVSHLLVDRRRGLAQGFDHFDESNILGDAAITGEGVTDAALAWLDRGGPDPFFLFVHYFDPHYEYRDHAEWDFADGYAGALDLRDLHIYDLRAQLSSLGPPEVQYLRDLYDEEVAYTDRAIGRLLEALPDDVAVILVGDHGEEILERGWLGHTISLRREVARVPLVMRLPGATHPGTRINEPVETRSVQPTVLDYLEIPVTPGSAPGSLLPLLRGEDAPDTLFSEVWLPDEDESTGKRVRRSLARRGPLVLVRDHETRQDQLFVVDWRGVERPATAPAAREALGRELDAWLRRMQAARERRPIEALSEEERRRLEALGYL